MIAEVVAVAVAHQEEDVVLRVVDAAVVRGEERRLLLYVTLSACVTRLC